MAIKPARIVDVSVAQGVIDWLKLAPAIDGAIIKATEGNGSIDRQFVANWRGALGAGRLLGTYHFAHPDTVHANDAEVEASAYVGAVCGAGWDRSPLIFALDIERGGVPSTAEFVRWVRTFVERVEALTGYLCWIYTGGPFWKEHAGKLSEADRAFFAARSLWIAAYVDDPSSYVAMTPWTKATMHQQWGDVGPHNQPGLRYPGVTANVVDTSLYEGTIDDLRAQISFGAIYDQPTPVPDTEPETPAGNPAAAPGARRGKSNPRLPAVREPGLEFEDTRGPATPIRAGEGEKES